MLSGALRHNPLPGTRRTLFLSICQVRSELGHDLFNIGIQVEIDNHKPVFPLMQDRVKEHIVFPDPECPGFLFDISAQVDPLEHRRVFKIFRKNVQQPPVQRRQLFLSVFIAPPSARIREVKSRAIIF